jgi:hypothetical protein
LITAPHSAYRSSLRRWLVIAAASLGVAASLGAPAVARAEDNKASCVEAYEEGQRARKQGSLLAAKEAFSFCSSDSCPRPMHADCRGWLAEVDPAIPKAVFDVSSNGGAALADVMITVDLGPARRLDAQPIALDPGAHDFVFTRAGYRELRERLVLAQGETNVRHFVLEPLPSADSTALPLAPPPTRQPAIDSGSSSTTMWPAWVAGGVGAAGMAGFAYFGLHGRSEDRALESCSPNCSVEQTDAVRRDYLIANVSLGVGVAGLLSAGAWILLAPNASGGKPRAAFDVQLGPITSLRHRF